MRNYFRVIGWSSLALLLAIIISGCAVGFYKGRPTDIKKISELEDELSRLNATKRLLEDRLKKEIEAKQVKLEMGERGLVITFVAEVLFDSGKAKLRGEGKDALDKIAKVLRDEALQNEIGIEGHTDNEPIKYSGWKSNWELSTARATTVLHYLEEKGIAPKKLSATGYGEYRPVASNDTVEGRQKNRRVEIIIKPIGGIEKVKAKPKAVKEEYIK